MIKKFFQSGLLALAIFVPISSRSQTSALSEGVKLYKDGDYQKAVDLLINTDDPAGTLYLGLAYEKLGDKTKSRKALESSLRRSYDEFYSRFLSWQQNAKADHLVDVFRETLNVCRVGAAAAGEAKKVGTDIFVDNEWRIKANVLYEVTTFADDTSEIYGIGDKELKPPNLIKRPYAHFPRNGEGESALVKLLVVLGSNGQVRLTIPTNDRFDAFTAMAIEAAGQIKFEPATKDRKPVSTWVNYEYSFRTE